MLEGIDLNDGAVGLVRKIMSDAVELANGIQNFLSRIGQPPILVGRQSKLFEQRKNFGMKIDIHAFGCAGSVENNSERTLRRDFGIEMLERTGGGISWIGKQR